LLVRAVELAHRELPVIKLLVLSRRHPDDMQREMQKIQQQLRLDGCQEYIRLEEDFLSREDLIRHVAACDLVALPFELVSSDAPISVLEVNTLAKPIITTQLACLPELVGGTPHWLIPPGDLAALSAAIHQASSEHKVNDTKLIATPITWKSVGIEWARYLESI
jgi:glycosyltransferase involved in cell wall biosynthesis